MHTLYLRGLWPRPPGKPAALSSCSAQEKQGRKASGIQTSTGHGTLKIREGVWRGGSGEGEGVERGRECERGGRSRGGRSVTEGEGV